MRLRFSNTRLTKPNTALRFILIVLFVSYIFSCLGTSEYKCQSTTYKLYIFRNASLKTLPLSMGFHKGHVPLCFGKERFPNPLLAVFVSPRSSNAHFQFVVLALTWVGSFSTFELVWWKCIERWSNLLKMKMQSIKVFWMNSIRMHRKMIGFFCIYQSVLIIFVWKGQNKHIICTIEYKPIHV